MATYVNDLRLKEIATGDESGTWGTSTNTNLELIAEAFSFGTEAITTNADTHTTTIADGSTDPGRSIYLKYTGALDSDCTVTIGPNTVSKLWFIENATTDSGSSGPYNIIIKQGSGATVTVPNGQVKAIYSDGAGSGGAMVEAFTNLNVANNLAISGSTPTLTIGDAGAEDTKIVFDGNAQDFYVGLDDSADDLVIGKGSTVGTNPAIEIDENMDIKFAQSIGVGQAASSTTGDIVAQTMSLLGTTPTLTLGDGGEEDVKIQFNGVKDFYIANDDSADKLVIGEGSTVGTNSILTITDDALTIGDAAEVDTKIVFDGNAQDYYVGLDDSADSLVLGLGSTVGTTPAITINSSQQASFAQAVTADAGVAIDNITIDGTEIDLSSGDLTLDVAGDIVLDAGGADILLKDDGTQFGELTNSSSDFVIKSSVSDKDIIFQGNDGGSGIEAMRIDMSAGGNVGIGTNSPVSIGGHTGVLTLFGSNATALVLKDSSGEKQLRLDDGNFSVRNSSGDTHLMVLNGGDVGIGTDSPSNPLHIAGASGTTILELQRTNTNTGGTTGGIGFTASDGHAVAGILAIADGDDEGAHLSLRTTSAASENNTFNSTSERMRIDSSGNVGIGTTSVDAFFVLDKDVSTAYDSTDDGAQRGSTNTLLLKNEDGTTNSFAQIAFDLAGSNQSIARIVGINSGTSTSDLAFVTESSNTKAEKLRIKGNGNVGIGTDSPNEKLVVSGNASVTGALQITSNTSAPSAGAALFRPADNTLAFVSTSNERMRIDSSGRLSVGISSSAGGVATFFGTGTGAEAKVQIEGEGGADPFINFLVNNTTHWSVGARDSDSDKFMIANNSDLSSGVALTIDSSENVGIGTASPSSALDVRGTVGISGGGDPAVMNRFSADANGPFIFMGSSRNASVGGHTIVQNGDALGGILFQGSDGTEFENGAQIAAVVDGTPGTNDMPARLEFRTTADGTNSVTERMRIASSGNIGINESSPDSFLHIDNGTSGTTKNLLHIEGHRNSSFFGIGILFSPASNSTPKHLVFNNVSGTAVGNISSDASSTSYATSSDARLKDITGSARGLEVINKLNPVAYNWKESGKADEGLVAQEVLEVVSNAVTGSEEEYYQMDYSKLVVNLVKGMQEQQEQIESLKSEIQLLKGGN